MMNTDNILTALLKCSLANQIVSVCIIMAYIADIAIASLEFP
uniref:Uncharacterized protein n=1 Tax=Anguilla anguilla TaxID=7936 RepID=A0A0E9Q030_ANGAN